MKQSSRILAILLSLMPAAAGALELGFESSLFADQSDNIFFDNEEPGLDGTVGVFGFSVFGQQKSDAADGGFLAELRLESISADDTAVNSLNNDEDNETFTRFYGGFSLATPLRALDWYIGDVLSGVLDSDQLQSIDSTGDRQLNVFVTGPELQFDVGVRKTLDLNLYYANQSDDTDDELDTFYRFGADFNSELGGGKSWGIRLSDIYTDRPDATGFEDFNRFSGAIFVGRERGVTLFNAEFGGTQYYSNGEGTNGLRLGVGIGRRISENGSINFGLSHDLIDQTLGTFQNLVNGQTARDDINGVSADSSIILGLESRFANDTYFGRLRATNSDFKLVADQTGFGTANVNLRDTRAYSLGVGFSRELTARISLTGDVNIERLEYLNRPDEIDSLSYLAALKYKLNNRWSAEIGARFLQEDGTISSVDSDGIISNERALDETENRYHIGLRWAPPSRASREVSGVVRSFL